MKTSSRVPAIRWLAVAALLLLLGVIAIPDQLHVVRKVVMVAFLVILVALGIIANMAAFQSISQSKRSPTDQRRLVVTGVLLGILALAVGVLLPFVLRR